jgi:16S rRNA processing protein RimM
VNERVLVGAISGAFGVKGEVRLKSFCAEPADIALYSPLWSENGDRQFALTITRTIPNGFSARISGVQTKEQADALRGARLFADRAALPSLPDDEFYYSDLIGLQVLDTGGTVIGTVADVQNHGAGDILEVKGAKPMLLPFTKAVVPTVDLAAGRIIIDPPDEIIAKDGDENEQ